MNKTIYVYGIINRRRARIEITSPQPGDQEYAVNIFKTWDESTAILFKGNMKLEFDDSYNVINVCEKNNGVYFIRLRDPSIEDIEYTKMLLANWPNYHEPTKYLLPNSEIIK